MDKREAMEVIGQEMERCFELPSPECETQLQQLFLEINTATSGDLMEELQNMIEQRMKCGQNGDKYRLALKAVKNTQ